MIVDEASGVADESWQAIDSLGFSKMLVAGNPISLTLAHLRPSSPAQLDREVALR